MFVKTGMISQWKWLTVIQLLLTQQTLCILPSALDKGDPPLLRPNPDEDIKVRGKDVSQYQQANKLSMDVPEPGLTVSQEEIVRSAQLLTSLLETKFQGEVHNHLHVQRNISCEDMLSASAVDDPLSSMFPQELLGLSLVPVLIVSGCPQEAQTLVLKLFDLLGQADTSELLLELEALIESRIRKFTPSPPTTMSLKRDEANRQIDAVMFNIKQLAMVGEGISPQEGYCEGWNKVNGTVLLGRAVKGASGGLKDAMSSCERLGVLCAGVTNGGPLMPGFYQAVLRKGSRIVPTASSDSECWVHQCRSQEEVRAIGPSGQRMKRSPNSSCINKKEEEVYNVVEWIPAVSTLYNIGTAVYYASVNCTATAKERAILSAVDLGTDALMVATGGTVGVAGYALGAGMKTGVKAGVRYLLNSMKTGDNILVNQTSYENGVFTVQ